MKAIYYYFLTSSCHILSPYYLLRVYAQEKKSIHLKMATVSQIFDIKMTSNFVQQMKWKI